MEDEFLVEIMTDCRVIKTYKVVVSPKMNKKWRMLGDNWVKRPAHELLVKVEKV